MPSQQKKWWKLKELKKLKRKQQQNGKRPSEKEKESGPAAEKKVRLEGLTTGSVADNKAACSDRNRAFKKPQQPNTSQQQHTPAITQPLMSLSVGDSAGPDLSGSRSGDRDGTRRMNGRDLPKGKSTHKFSHWGTQSNRHDGHFDRNGVHVGGDDQSDWTFGNEYSGLSGLYTPFDQEWPDPRMPAPTFSSDRWNGPGHRNRFQEPWEGVGPGLNGRQGPGLMPPPSSYHRQAWNREHFTWNKNTNRYEADKDSLSSSNDSTGGSHNRQNWDLDGNKGGSRWNRFTRQFQDNHFHREDGPRQDTPLQGEGAAGDGHRSLASSQADSSGLDESSGSTGRKRSHSTEEEKRLSKSSRGESSCSVGASSTVTSSSAGRGRSKAVFDLKGSSSTQKPDSTSVKVKSHSSGDISRRLMSHPAAVTTTKPNGPAVKKKQFAESAKNLAVGVRPKSAAGSVPGGEGVLEKAERICKELREKRKQAAQKQATLTGRPAETMNKSLDDSVHSLQSTQSSCFKGYMSDSNVPASAGSSSSGATQASGRASPSFSHLSDVARIRHGIESSVLAEGRTAIRQHAALDAVSRPLRIGGACAGGSVPNRRLSTPSSATAVAAPSSTSTTNKPPRPQALSKEALARMVNSPQSRAQRVQLARMLRLHTNTSAARPRHTRLNLQIDGDNDDAGNNSVEDVLKDLGGLQELECLGELRNTKLEDLTTEDKLRIAQLIEDADRNSSSCDMDRDHSTSAEVSASGLTSLNGKSSKSSRTTSTDISKRQTHQPDTSSYIANVDVMEIDSPSPQKARLLSPQRVRTPSPNPNRPLSIDDLGVAMSTEKDPVPAAKSPVRVLCSPIRSSSADLPSVSDTVHAHVLGVKKSAETPADDTTDHTGYLLPPFTFSRPREITSVMDGSREVTSVAAEMHDACGELYSEHEAEEEQSHQHFEDTAETMDTSDVLSPLTSILSMQAGSTASSGEISRQAGILHEVLGLCQRQDSVLSEMRGIDVQLSQLYKSLIEIVARMSSLQRRRVQLQGEGEQLSQQRNSLLAGIIPGSSTQTSRDHHPAGQRRQSYSSASATLTSFTAPATATSMSLSRDVCSPAAASSSKGEMVPPSLGSAVILPSWLTTTSTSQSIGDGRAQNTVVPIQAESTQGSDVCLSGSVSSSVHSETPTEPQQKSSVVDGPFHNGNYISMRSGSGEQAPLSSVNTQHSGSMLSQVAVSASSFEPSSKRPSSSREPRIMLSLGDTDSSAASKKSTCADVANLHGSEKNIDLTVSSISVNSSNTVSAGRQPRDTHLMESSSGIGSSIVTGISSSSLAQQNHDSSGQSDLSNLHPDSDQGSITSMWDARHCTQQDSSSKPTAISKSIFSFTSPQPGSSGMRSQTQSSPGMSVSYIGSISSSTTSDLVQQIVRNLPITSQLGEVGSPRSMSMYLLKSNGAENRSPSVDAASRERSTSDPADILSSKTRTRSTSLSDVSIVSDLGFQDKSAGVGHSSQKSPTDLPRLDLSVSGDTGHSKVDTPHSESDGSSVVSSASLGEQIKFMSEKNGTTAVGATHSLAHPVVDDDIELIEDGDKKNNTPDSSVRGCSIVLQRLDLENSMTSEFFKEPKETEKPKKKMKTKKDRNKVLQNRRHFFVDSSSEDHASTADDDSLPDLDIVPQEVDFNPLVFAATGTVNSTDGRLLKGVNRIHASRSGDNVLIVGETDDLDLTLVSEEGMKAIYDDDVEENRPATSSGVGSSRLKMKADKQKVFRADQGRNLNPPSSPCVVGSDSGTDTLEPQNPSASRRKKKKFSVCGPSAPVMGLEVYKEQLYVCYLRHGVHSYSLRDAQQVAVYPMESALCFVVRPTCLAFGCEDRLAFVSLNNGGRKILGSIDTVVKVMCLLATETKLFAGLDCGAVIVASFRTFQMMQRFQASDSAIHCMAWTREGSTRLLCVSDQNANIHVLDAGSGLPVRSLTGHTKTSFALCMMDHHIISGSGDRSVMAHDVHTAEIVWKLQDHKGLVTSICVDNGLLFSTGYDRVIRCYDLKSRRLLHLMYGAGKSIVMRMVIHNSVLYSGNREGQIEAVDLRDMSSFTCGCDSCGLVFGLKEHLQHHLTTDHHNNTDSHATPCPWRGCFSMIQPEIWEEHLQSHTESK